LAVVNQLFEKSLQSPTPITVQVPDSKLVVNVNISQGETLVSDVLVKSMNGVRQGVPITVLQQRLQTVVDELFKGGVDLIDVKNECMALYIRFANFNSWLEFLSKYLTGIIAKAFLPVQEHLRTYLGFEDLELKVDVYEEDFEKCVQSILYQLAPTMLTVCGQDGERNDKTHTIDQLSLYVSPGRPVESYVTQGYVLTDEDLTYPNKLLIRGIPLYNTEIHIAKYMLATTGYIMEQGSMTFHTRDPTVALATFKENIDINKVIRTCTARPLDNAELLFSPVPMTRNVYITHLPADLDTETIKSYFDSQSKNSVLEVNMKEDRVSCIVIFRNTAIVDILLRLTHTIAGRHIEVYRYFPCIERSETAILTSAVYEQTTVCVSRPRNEEMDVLDSQNYAGFLGDEDFIFKREIQCVHLEYFLPYHLDLLNNHDVGDYRSIQLNINGYRRLNVTEFIHFLKYETEHSHIALDKIYFCTSKPELLQSLTEAIQQKNCDQPTSLAQVESSSATTYSDKLLVTGLSKETQETDMEQFLCRHTGHKLKTGSMLFHATRTDTAMVTFDNAFEYQSIVDKCKSHKLHGCELRFSKVQVEYCVILSKLKETVNEEMILSYFNRNGPIVHKVDVKQRKGRCLVFFDKETDANEALCTEHNFGGQTVTVHRYFTSIERSEPDIISCKRIHGLTVCVSHGNWSEMRFDKIEKHSFKGITVTNYGLQYFHAQCFWKPSLNIEKVINLAAKGPFKSIGFILDEADVDESIERIISWITRPNYKLLSLKQCLDKVYFCCTEKYVLERLHFVLSNLVGDWSSSDDDLTNPWFFRKGVKSTHYEKSQLSTSRIPVTPESKGLLKKRSISDKADSKFAVHTATKLERAKETDQPQEIIKLRDSVNLIL
ncbi:hypothetical protein DPMN_119643, partial [Dreissena polymorpha]